MHSADERSCRELEALLKIGEVRTALCVPLTKPGGGAFGVLLCVNRLGGRYFSREDQGMARNLGVQGGSVLYNVHVYEKALGAHSRSEVRRQT